ncbi:MAG: ExoA family glycosyltransferase [Pseudomonadota bacterium]
MGKPSQSKVSIIMPVLNEEKYIKKCLLSLINGIIENIDLEILIIDGMSTDSTRSIINDLRKDYDYIRIVDNPERNKPAALNLGIAEASGEIVIRVDAHSIYDADYINRTVYYLNTTDADNVGGIRRTLPGDDNLIARAIAHAVSNPFAAGNAVYRTLSNDKSKPVVMEVDTVFGGGFPRDLFARIGDFDRDLLRGQDREFNHRIRAHGGKILLCTDIVCDYFARSDINSYVSWMYDGGVTPFYISRIVGRKIYSWRNLIPLAFIISLLVSIILSFFIPYFWIIALVIMFSYILGSIIFTVPVVKKEKNPIFFLIMPAIFLLTHIPYGFGSISGMLRRVKKGAQWVRT